MTREVEIKFQISNKNTLTPKLKALGFRLKTPRTYEMNTLYDFSSQTLRRRGEMLRIRQYGPKWTITHKAKGQAGRHKSRMETEIAVSEGKAAEAIFNSLGLQPIFRYEKFRAEWSDPNGHLVLDDTPIGVYAELEGPPRWIDRVAKRLGVVPADYITQTYADLFQDWKKRTGSPVAEMTFRAVKAPGCNRRVR
jgi:adenylate cyclase class 2